MIEIWFLEVLNDSGVSICGQLARILFSLNDYFYLVPRIDKIRRFGILHTLLVDV